MYNQQYLKALQIIEDIEEKHNRTLPFTYLFKGVYEFEVGNYVVAVEHF